MPAYRISLSCFRHLARAVLMMYVLTLGVAMASSLVKSDGMGLICTSTGYKFINQNGDISDKDGKGINQGKSHLLDCSLCVATGLPASMPQLDAITPPHELSYATRSIPAARLASLVAAPMPARGPPGI
ncbi:DUF2946 family protein [Undibacterium sp. TJN19]|uniref:DUF2946 family protein n=1 Tax=Undibacterium sp. TJN19 TaxID=3413055 RepID=UPI003BF42C0F